MNDCISYRNSDNLNNQHNRDEEMHTCRKWGKKDICEGFLSLGNPEQIDVCKYGIDIFDFQIYLCHIYKVNESCNEGTFVL